MNQSKQNPYPKGRWTTPTDVIKDQEALEEAHVRRNEQAEKKAHEKFIKSQNESGKS